MHYWLMKSEPDTFSLEDLIARPKQTSCWEGVRNYQARNYMRDDMRVGDRVLFYHSSCKEPGVVGLARVAKESYPDYTAWDKKSPYFDPKSSPENPRWFMVDIYYEATLPQLVSLKAIRESASLQSMKLLQRGQRLSIQPVSAKEYQAICKLGGL